MITQSSINMIIDRVPNLILKRYLDRVLNLSYIQFPISDDLMPIIFQVDKIFASILPIGRYPLFSVSRITVIVRLSWLVSLVISISVNAVYPCSYEPSAVLCIPLLPSGFFYTLLSFLCLVFVCLIIGFTAIIFFLKKVRQWTKL